MNRSREGSDDEAQRNGSDGPDERIAARVRRATAGDHEAFRELYERCADDVHRTARWMLGSDDVDDAVQEVFIRAWEKLGTLSDPAAFRPWLRRLAVNVVLRIRSRRSRRRDREPSVGTSAPPASGKPTPGLGVDLERAVSELPEGARRVFVLYDVQGFSHREIGELLGVSPHTSRSQLHRARALLRERLAGGDR